MARKPKVEECGQPWAGDGCGGKQIFTQLRGSLVFAEEGLGSD